MAVIKAFFGKLFGKLKEDAKTPHGTMTILIVIVAIMAFFLGRGLKPEPEIQYKEHDHVVVKTQIEYQDRVVEKKVYVAQKQKEQVVQKNVVTTVAPDGSRTTVDKSVVVTGEQTNIQKTDNIDHTTQITQKTTATEDKDIQLKQSSAQPQWRVGAGVGLNIPNLSFSHGIGAALTQSVIYSGEVDRRIIGPFWLGIWGNSAGIAGLQLSFEFGAK